jgi:hypothetical protein
MLCRKIPAWHLLIYFIEYDDPPPMADTEEAKKGGKPLSRQELRMDRFVRFSFEVAFRDASFVAVGAVTLMIAFSFDPPLALVIGAHVALIFSLFLLYRVTTLTDERVKRTEPWRGLEPNERPRGDHALALAHDRLEEVLLRFSKSSAGVACTLFVLSLGVSILQRMVSLS